MISQTPAVVSDQHRAIEQVWLLEKGEANEGGSVHGVYLDRDLGIGDFIDLAREIGSTFGLDEAETGVGPDGSLHTRGGCDWLSLRPYPVTSRRALSTANSTT